MDRTLSLNDGKTKKANPSVSSPIKDQGKTVIGFQGFKLINSKIKLVKQVDVKASAVKQKEMQKLELDEISSSTIYQTPDCTKKLSTADSLRQIREKIQSRKKMKESNCIGNDVDDSQILSPDVKMNGIDKSHDTNVSKYTSDKSVLKSSSGDNEIKTISKRSPRKSETRSKSKDRSEASYSRRHTESRRHRERSRSPYRDKEHSGRERSYRSHSTRRRRPSHESKSSSSSYKSRESKDSSSHFQSHHSKQKGSLSKDEAKHKRFSSHNHKSSDEHSTTSSQNHISRNISINPTKNIDAGVEFAPNETKECNSDRESANVSSVPTSEIEEYVVRSACSSAASEEDVPDVSSEHSDKTEAVAIPPGANVKGSLPEDGIFTKISDAYENSTVSVVLPSVEALESVEQVVNIADSESGLPDMHEIESASPILGIGGNLSNSSDDTPAALIKCHDKQNVKDTTNEDCTEFNQSHNAPELLSIEENDTFQKSSSALEGSPLLHDAEVLSIQSNGASPYSQLSEIDETSDILPAEVISPDIMTIPVDTEEAETEIMTDASAKTVQIDNKIPTLASKLKNVFDSLLRTDFKTSEIEHNTQLTKLNGIVQTNTDIEGESSLHLDNATDALINTQKSDKNDIDSVEDTMSKTTLSDDASIAQAISVSPDKSCRVSPHSNKLKLHATTKTPLPAKKSYIQQVQSDSERTRFTSNSESESPSPTTHPTELDLMLGIKSEANFTCEQALNNEKNILFHCDQKPVDDDQTQVASSHSDLLRQDSSGSSTNDNEDGPRRSARIRTKKSEKGLHKMVVNKAVEASSDSKGNVSPNTNQVITGNASVHSNQNNTPKRKEMSKEDLFKTKIRLAADVTDDCPELFDLLDENLYLTSKKKSRARKEIRRMICECAFEENSDADGPCGGNCLNRLLMIECSSRCHFGDQCTNKRFQHRIYAATEVFKTSFKGWGIRAADNLSPGELIMEYCGEVVDQPEFTRRSLEYSKSNHAHFYFMALSQDEVIDATYKGNSSRFINHSCDPNAETQKWTVNGRLRVGFFTLRNIEKGEEITFDYQFERYGKVAQKCYCGTAKCRGYLGKAPDENDDKDTIDSAILSNDALSPSDNVSEDETSVPEKDKAKRKKKKISLFADDTMVKDISKLLGGLRSSKEVLTLSRLMVRCDTHSQRVMCLRVLKETTSQTRLKTFLQFHGLSIIWSWMVDVGGVEDTDAYNLKMEIINTLCILPINNKNVIEDSKVLSVVQRWAKQDEEDKSKSEETDAVDPEKKEEDTAQSENEKPDNVVQNPDTDENKEEKESSNIIVSTDVNNETPEEIPKEKQASEEDFTDDKTTTNTSEIKLINDKILSAAASLLDSWKDLKEIYRIPKRQKPLNSPSDFDSNSRDHSRTSSPTPKHSRSDEYEDRRNRPAYSRRDSSQDSWRDRDSLDRGWDGERSRHRDRRSDYSDNRYSPGSSHSYENRKEPGRRKRRFSTDSDDSKNVPWHCRPPRNSRFESKMSRQEYRKRFEKDVQKRELEKKRRIEERMESDNSMTPNMFSPMHSFHSMNDGPADIPSLMGQDVPIPGHGAPVNATFTPSGYSGNLIQINPTQPAPVIIEQPYLNMAVNQQMVMQPQIIQQNQFGMQIPVQPGYDMMGGFNQDPNIQVNMQGPFDMNMQNQPINAVGQQIIPNSIGMIPQQPVIQQQSQNTFVQQQQPQPPPTANNLTILGSQNGQAIVLLTPEQLQKLTQGNAASQASVQQSFEPAKIQPTVSTSSNKIGNDISTKQPNLGENKNSKSCSGADSKSTSPSKLPPNWKTAHDAEGRIYYYHAITRQTQWDAPTWDGKDEDMIGKKEAEMDLSSTPTHDERRHKSSRNKNDNVTEEGKKAQETFRLHMSQFVVQCLSQYRKSDRKVGRITSTEDFKHLARKLTHNIMQKEIKQVLVWEDLDFNSNVKHKTKEYVKKYMSKVGPIYRIRDDNPMDTL